MRAIILIAAGLTLAACSSTGQPIESASGKTAELARACSDRGGILVPSPGQMTGRPEVDNFCKIEGAMATRIPPQQ
ncbi:hypothetical protein [Brevundimonas lenta]|uniref:Lipoprotein n=1 Tax=Brevundimonas lenta TaxID=424796 RepID=A0A7W6NRM2_9CAUL|nr:hypothetical protein [Brevundimonas lenta]MBB4084335.1 hypothetical protein [Brevundimonas lenta]